jgi:hypothetical protein
MRTALTRYSIPVPYLISWVPDELRHSVQAKAKDQYRATLASSIENLSTQIVSFHTYLDLSISGGSLAANVYQCSRRIKYLIPSGEGGNIGRVIHWTEGGKQIPK